MFSISSINRRLKKERIYLALITVLLVLVLVAATAAGFHIERDHNRSMQEAHVSYMIGIMSDRFEKMIVNSIEQVDVASVHSDIGELERSIKEIAASDMFDGAVVLNERSRAVVHSGSIPESTGNFKVIRYPYRDRIAYICVQSDGVISIRMDTLSQYDIQAWIRGEYIDELFADSNGDRYDYCLFDASTGAYIINRAGFSDYSYYETLLTMNEKGRMRALLNAWRASGLQPQVADVVKHNESEFYIGQAGTGIGNISVAVTIPLEQMQNELGNPPWNKWVISGVIAVGILAILIASFLVFRHERRIARLAARSNRISDMLLHRASNGAKMTLMLYDATSDTFSVYCESNRDRNLYGNEDPANLREFALRYHIIDEDIERMYAACRGLKVEDRTTMNLTALREDGERSLHLHMHAVEEEGLIICSMYDCTNEIRANERMQQEEVFRNSVLPRSMASWEINVTANTWKATYCAKNANKYMRDFAAQAKTTRDYEHDLAQTLRTIIHPDDYSSYVSAVNTDALTLMYHSGVVENVHEYRVRSNQKKGYEWHRQIVRMQKSMDSEDIIASLYVINIDAERTAETERRERNRILQQSLTALGGVYFALFYIDLDNDTCYTAKAPKGELVSQVSAPYKAKFDAYIDRIVQPEDRERIRDALSAYRLRREMTETDHLVYHIYHRRVDDRYEEAVLLIQAARFENGTVRDVVIALRDRNHEKI